MLSRIRNGMSFYILSFDCFNSSVFCKKIYLNGIFFISLIKKIVSLLRI